MRHWILTISLVGGAIACGSDEGAEDAGADSATGDNGCAFMPASVPRWTCDIGGDVVVALTIVEDSTAPEGASRIVRIEPVRNAAAMQQFPGMEIHGEITESVIESADLDGDGRLELLVRRDIGHPNNEGREIFFFDQARRAFVHDSVLSAETNVEPDSTGCVRSQGWLGGGHTVERRLCRDRGGWREVKREEYQPPTPESP